MTATVGYRRMLGLTLRHERIHTPVWFGGAAVLLVLIAVGVNATYPTAEARSALADSVAASTGELLLIGPVSSADPGGIGLWRMLGAAQIVLGVLAVLTVVRNTRTLEESGTLEMLGGARTGRATPVAAALTVVAAGSVFAGIIVMLSFSALTGSPWSSALVGIQVALLGLTSAAVAGIASQVMRTSRGAAGVGVVIVAVFYLLRGLGDVTGGAGSWLSPFGWITAIRPFDTDDSALALPPVALVLVLALLSMRTAARRDLGAGILPDRPGRASASSALTGPISLALRLARPMLVGVGVGALAVGALVGGVAAAVDKQIDLRAAGLGNAGLVPLALYLSPMFAAVAGLHSVLRSRAEVKTGRAEELLAQPISRGRWLMSHVVTAAMGALVVQALFGVGLGLARPADLGALALASVLRVPAAWLFVGIAALLLGSRPGAAAATTYALLAAFILFEFLIEFRLLPPQALYASPFALVPQLPTGPGHTQPAVGLLAIAAIAVLTGAVLARRKDLQ